MTDEGGYAEALTSMPMESGPEEEVEETASIEMVISELQRIVSKLQGMSGGSAAAPAPPMGDY